MRLDKFLKVSRLIKRRTVANEACDAGRVLVNDKPAKASLNVKTGDIIEIQFGMKSVKVEVLDVAEIILDTDMGLLTVKGKSLHVSRLTLEKGEVDIEGTFDSFAYSSNENYRKSGESLFNRLFK